MLWWPKVFAIWAAAWRFKKQANGPNRRIPCIWLFPGASKVRFHTVFIDKPGLRLKRKCCFPQVFHRGLKERISTPCPTCRWRRDALVAQTWKSKAFLHGMVVDSFLKAFFKVARSGALVVSSDFYCKKYRKPYVFSRFRSRKPFSRGGKGGRPWAGPAECAMAV